MRFKKNKPYVGTELRKVIGAYTLLDLNEYLTLYSIETNESKSSVIETLLIDFRKEKLDKGLSIKYLATSIAAQGFQMYKSKPGKKNQSTFNKFLKESRDELIKIGVLEETVELIISKIKDEKKKQA